jgi:glycosyltransferase involved in cell wall biosynthesis
LLQIFSRIHQEFSSTKLIVIGDGPEKKNLLSAAQEMLPVGSYSFTGILPNASKLFLAIDILCVPSSSEGMPNVIMEALLSGVPVVANDVGAVSMLIQHGRNGFLVPLGDDDQFYNFLYLLVADNNKRLQIGQAGRTTMEKEFNVERMAEHFICFYRQRIDAKHGN